MVAGAVLDGATGVRAATTLRDVGVAISRSSCSGDEQLNIKSANKNEPPKRCLALVTSKE